MTLEQICENLNKKHSGNSDFSFRITHDGYLEVKYNPKPKNVVKVNSEGWFEENNRWFGGSNSNGVYTKKNQWPLKDVEWVIDRLLTIPGTKNRDNWEL